jgi:hypothetical protein
MLNARSRTKQIRITPNTRSVSALTVRTILVESNQDFEAAIRLTKQREQRELEMHQPISNNPMTGTTREQEDGNATYHEILDVADYEVQQPDSLPAKLFPTAKPMSGQAKAPASAMVNAEKVARVLGSTEGQ